MLRKKDTQGYEAFTREKWTPWSLRVVLSLVVAIVSMADVVSEVSDGTVAAAEGCLVSPSSAAKTGNSKDIAADEGVSNKVSIHKILEGMTNEFNRGISPVKQVDNADKTAVIIDEVTATLLPPSKVVEEESKDEEERDEISEKAVANSEDPEVQPVLEENHNEEDDDSTDKQETLKKDNNGGIPRIVLTFRTIDENTDHGKKTKISSCSSNFGITLVHDELANCTQIGGVSVKIENSDDNSDIVEEPSAEEVKEPSEEPAKEEEKSKSKDVTENKVEDATKQDLNNKQVSAEEKTETVKDNPENNNVETAELEGSAEVENTEQRETAAPVTRKRRTGRPRLRTLRFLFIFPLFIFVKVCFP